MKTAIAVPDAVFERVERRVKALGMSRSEFYSRAAERYLLELDRVGLTARIDAAVNRTKADPGQREIADLGLRRLEDLTADDEW